jgi:hypothetical protein
LGIDVYDYLLLNRTEYWWVAGRSRQQGHASIATTSIYLWKEDRARHAQTSSKHRLDAGADD